MATRTTRTTGRTVRRTVQFGPYKIAVFVTRCTSVGYECKHTKEQNDPEYMMWAWGSGETPDEAIKSYLRDVAIRERRWNNGD